MVYFFGPRISRSGGYLQVLETNPPSNYGQGIGSSAGITCQASTTMLRTARLFAHSTYCTQTRRIEHATHRMIGVGEFRLKLQLSECVA